MLRQPSSQQRFAAGLVEHQCPRCARRVELPFGETCGICRREIARRARRIARMVSLASTAVVGIWVAASVPNHPDARLIGGAGVLAWYILSYIIVRRTALLWIR